MAETVEGRDGARGIRPEDGPVAAGAAIQGRAVEGAVRRLDQARLGTRSLGREVVECCHGVGGVHLEDGADSAGAARQSRSVESPSEAWRSPA